MHNRTLKKVKRKTVSKGTQIYCTRFVDVVKLVDNETNLNSRSVAQNYLHEDSSESQNPRFQQIPHQFSTHPSTVYVAQQHLKTA